MLGLLPLLGLLAFWAALRRIRSPGTRLLSALVLWGCAVVISTEALSVFEAVSTGAVASFWTLVVVACLWFHSTSSALERASARKALICSLRVTRREPLLYGGVWACIVLTLLTGLCSAPNYWDAMVYHLPRVEHWVQNGSVDHYPTSVDRQLYMPPFNAYAMLHFRLLTGGDRLAFLPQWIAFVGSIVAASRIARRLGAGERARALAALLVATIPMALLQASSVQSDLLVAFWVACAADFATVGHRRHLGGYPSVRLGAAAGLALLSKLTAVFVLAPVLAVFFLAQYRTYALSTVLRSLVTVLLVVFLINSPHWSRNRLSFGDVHSPPATRLIQGNRRPGLEAALSNTIRAAAMHLGSGGAPQRSLEQAVEGLHDVLGMDSQSSSTTIGRFHLHALQTDESKAGNALHLMLAVGAILCALSRPRPEVRPALLLALATCVGFVLLNAILKWEVVRVRLHLPLFVLAAAWTAALCGQFFPRPALAALGLVCLVGALPWVITNRMRPLLSMSRFTPYASVLTTSREEEYFRGSPVLGVGGEKLQEEFEAVVRMLSERRIEHIVLVGGDDAFEYGLWVLLRRELPGARLSHELSRLTVTARPRGREAGAAESTARIWFLRQRRPEADQALQFFGAFLALEAPATGHAQPSSGGE